MQQIGLHKQKQAYGVTLAMFCLEKTFKVEEDEFGAWGNKDTSTDFNFWPKSSLHLQQQNPARRRVMRNH